MYINIIKIQLILIYNCRQSMADIEPLFDAEKYQEAADLLPAPDEMESDYGTIEQTSVPAETVFYSIRRNGKCAFAKKGPEKHKLFFFVKTSDLAKIGSP